MLGIKDGSTIPPRIVCKVSLEDRRYQSRDVKTHCALTICNRFYIRPASIARKENKGSLPFPLSLISLSPIPSVLSSVIFFSLDPFKSVHKVGSSARSILPTVDDSFQVLEIDFPSAFSVSPRFAFVGTLALSLTRVACHTADSHMRKVRQIASYRVKIRQAFV